MRQYLDIGKRIVDEGVWVHNERTNTKCKTIIGANMSYNVANNECPIITTRKSYYRKAIAELLGYIRGCGSAADFRALGTDTWDANANKNTAWLNNPNRIGEDDMGRVYGVQGRAWQGPNGVVVDQLMNIYLDLKRGIDNRGEILLFWNPGEENLGCLRPCMYSHTFSLLGDQLYLTSVQRSADWPLGMNFNMIQVFTFLKLMAQITGTKPMIAHHNIVNAHIYEDQFELFKTQLERTPREGAKMTINPEIKTLDDVLTWVTVKDFFIEDYDPHPEIKYPFTV